MVVVLVKAAEHEEDEPATMADDIFVEMGKAVETVGDVIINMIWCGDGGLDTATRLFLMLSTN